MFKNEQAISDVIVKKLILILISPISRHYFFCPENVCVLHLLHHRLDLFAGSKQTKPLSDCLHYKLHENISR